MDGMNEFVADLDANGLEVIDCQDPGAFPERELSGAKAMRQMEAMTRLGRAFLDKPDAILQELADSAVATCESDSAGISIEINGGTDEEFYRWVATSGVYTDFLGAILPRYPSACGLSLIRGRAQRFRVTQRFFDILGVEAPPVTDGILLPWEVGGTRGTIFVMDHKRSDAFDCNDVRMMEMLADFAAMAVRHQEQQSMVAEKAKLAAENAMSRELAHHLNNPLQSLTAAAYLVGQGVLGEKKKLLAEGMTKDIETMTSLVKRMMQLAS